ncbi:MAG: pitrilysin family protein [Desulfobacterales bacterium]
MNRCGLSRPSAKYRPHPASCLNGALILVFFLAFFVQGGIARATGRENPEAADDALRATLKNGLRVVIVRNSLAPVATTVMNYLVGSNDAPPGFPGMAHAQEHMLFRGSPDLSADQLAAVTAAVGGKFNADTQQTVTQYFFTVPVQDLDFALHVEALRMSGVLDSGADWNQERGAIEQEVAQNLSDPDYVFYSRLLAAMFTGTPYAHTPLGTKASLDHTTGKMLRDFYHTWYAPNNAVLVITGAVDPSKVLAQVRRLFDGIPAREIPARSPVELEPVEARTLRLATDRPQGLAVIAFRMPGSTSPQYAATRVLADLLGSRRGQLQDLVIAGKALSVDFSLEAMPAASIGYATAAFPQGAAGDALLDLLRTKIDRQLSDGLTSDLVQAAQRHAVTAGEMRKNSVSGMAMSWSQAVAVENRRSPRENLEAIARVRPIDVAAVARNYLDPDAAIRVVLTPKPSGAPAAATAAPHLESFARQPATGVRLPEWAAGSLKQVKIPDLRIQPADHVLPNGIRLIVQPESVSRIVSIYGHIHNIPQITEPQGREGVDRILGQLFSYGTTTLDRLGFQKALDDIGASESAGTDFSLVVLKDHLDQGAKLLADHLLHPTLPQAAFETVRSLVASAVAGELQSPGYLFQRSLRKALFPADDPTLRQTTPETVRSLTLSDVRAYYGRVFRPDLTTIVVIGPVDYPEAEELISTYFSAWRATGARPQMALPPVPLSPAGTVTVPNDTRVQDKVVLAETLGLNRSSPDYYALQLGNHVLGGGFYATRLYRDLREKNGLVYFVSSAFDMDRTRGIYLVSYASDPAKVSAAQRIVQQNLAQLQREPVSAAELQLAKAMLLKEIPLAESSTTLIAEGLIARVELDLPLREPLLAARRYLELSAGQVEKAFAKWVRPESLVRVAEGPGPE